MPFDALGNYIPDDEEMSLDAMKYELAKKGTMPLRPNGSDVPYVASQVPQISVPVTPKEPPKPYSTSSNFAQAMADRMGITAIPQALMAMGTGFASEVAKGMGYPEASKAMQYEPTSRVANDVLAGLEEAPKVITGSHMGFGPMPETWITGMGSVSPDDVRVLAKRGIETGREIKAIPEDFRNAQSGVTRQNYKGEPTYGVKLQSVADDLGDVMARQEARRNRYETSPKSSVEVFGDMVPESKLYAVRNTGEGQMMRPVPSEAGVRPSNVTYGETEELLSSLAPELDINRPDSIIDSYETHYMEGNTLEQRALQDKWERFYKEKAKELFPHGFTADDALKALRKGYPPREVRDMRLKWFHDFVNEANASGVPIPTMEEYLTRAQAANLITKKIIPNVVQKYMGTPNDPFIESAKKGVTFTPAEELLKYETPSQQLMHMRTEGGFAPQGEIADKLMPVAESKLATKTTELEQLIEEQNQVSQNEGMMVPYPDGRIDPETGQVAMATNPNYAKFTNKIGAMRKSIEDTEEEIRNLKLAQSYENVSDAAIRMKPAHEVRYNIPREEEQFYPQLFAQKPREYSISPTIYKTPDEAKMFEVAPSGFTQAGMKGLTSQLVSDIMQGKIPPEQIPNLAQPHTITKYMSDIVAPRLEKEKAARLAQKTYKTDAENHFIEVLNTIPDSMRVGNNAKLLWLDEGFPQDEINQHLSDETFVLDHCIGQSGNGRGLKNLFTGDERAYIPLLDPVTGQKFKGANNTSTYMDAVESGDKDIMMIRDDKTGMPVGTIELSKSIDPDTEDTVYDIGYVSGYKNHSNKFGGIDPKYREALRDALNLVKDEVVSTSGNEARSGVFDMRDRDQLNSLKNKLDLPNRTTEDKQKAWAGVQRNIFDNLDGDRYITIEQAEEALKQYKADNPPVPAVRTGFPPAGRESTERNIIMQGLSRDNLDTTRQFNAARIVADGTRFDALPLAPSQMEPRPLAAYRGILNSMSNRAGNTGMSDYEVFRNLQDYVDQIDNGDLRFADFNLGGHSELTDLKDGLQKHADAMGQLAHYADVLQRNGYRSPLPSEQTGTPEWQAYQRFMGELDLNDPQDISTRLRDMINHGDPREIDPNLDELQRENFRHLLEIHYRSLKQAVNFPAPTTPAPQVGLPLRDYERAVQSGLETIQANFGNQTRETIGNIMVDAIGQNMGTAVNERPTQVSDYLNTQAQEASWPISVRRGLRDLAGTIDQAYANYRNVQNAPTNALPSSQEYSQAVTRAAEADDHWLETAEVYDDIVTRMRRDGDLPHQHPQEVVSRLIENANFRDGEGETNAANGLRNLAREISTLIPANPPASMALAMENRPLMVAGGMDNLTPMQAIGARIAQLQEVDRPLANSVMRMLDTYDYANQITQNPAELIRGLRNEANEAMEGGEAEFGHALINVTNDIANATGGTTFTPAVPRAEPRRTPRDIALSVNGLVGENIDEMANLIQIELRDLPTDRVALRQADLFYQDANNLPDEITNLIHDYPDAERVANYIRQHIESRLGNLPQRENQLTTAEMPTPRDVAQRVAPDSTHQNLDQRRRQVQTIAEGINNEIRSLPNDMAGLERALEFYQDYDNLPAEMMARIPSEEDANIVLGHIRQHIENRISNLPENRGQDLQASYERVSDEIRNTYTNNYLQRFQDGDVDIRNNVLQDVADRPSVYGLARLSAQQQRDMVERLRAEGLYDPWVAEEPQRLPADEGHTFNTMGRIQEAIGRRGASVNREHLGISQQFDQIVETASQEFNPQRQPERFVTSLLQRASSVENNNRTEVHPARRELARQLRLMADDVQALIETAQAQGLPAPAQQQAGTGALSATEQVIARSRAVDFLNGDRNAIRELEPADRQMVQVLTRYNEAEPNILNELDHRRLINTLTSQTYNPATDGEALIRLAETRAGMFAGLDDSQREQVIDIVNKWNFLRFPNYAPSEAGMGEDPQGHKRGGAIKRKMFMTEGGKVLTPYEQFKLDNAKLLEKPAVDHNAPRTLQERMADQAFFKNTPPKPSGGGAGYVPGSRNPFNPDSPLNKRNGGRVHMNEGGVPDFEGSYLMHPDVQRLVSNGEIAPADARWMSDYAHTKGDKRVETGSGPFKDQSEKMQNFVGRMERGEVPIPKHMAGEGGVNRGSNSSGLNPARVGGGGGGGGGAGADLEFQGLNTRHPKAIYAGGGGVRYQNPEDLGGFFDYTPSYYQNVADKIQPDGQAGGYNDATRHILASADMTRRFGEVPASLLGYGHEAWNYLEGKFNGRPQTNEDMQQDLHNNAVGRQIGKNASSFQDIVNRVPQALDVRPYQTESNKAMVRHPNEAKTPYKPFGAFQDGGDVNIDAMRLALMKG